MTFQSSRPRGLYFEEFEIGQRFVSTGRTITESDIVTFAGLSGDNNQIHIDAEFSKTTPFGQRVAHGLLVTSIASGLIALSGLIEGTVLAFREINNWKFTKPVFIGDTVHVETEVAATKAIRRLGGGAVTIILDVINQHGETVMKGKWTILIVSECEGATHFQSALHLVSRANQRVSKPIYQYTNLPIYQYTNQPIYP
ncbi:MAG: MaoC family dehydratase N-terminal domain-containing protein [Chloroflexi bacterium]|nr:MaoC family dehydratase N-terminal domain-containing protein [Chloroflexota bacterium]